MRNRDDDNIRYGITLCATPLCSSRSEARTVFIIRACVSARQLTTGKPAWHTYMNMAMVTSNMGTKHRPTTLRRRYELKWMIKINYIRHLGPCA